MRSWCLLRAAFLVFSLASLAGCQILKVTKGESDPGTLAKAQNLGFDQGAAGDGDPQAWDRRGGNPDDYFFSVDQEIKRSGNSSAMIQLKPGVANASQLDTSLIQCLETENLVGKAFHVKGWIKTEEVEGQGAALWIGAYGSGDSTTGGWFPSDDEWRRGSLEWSLYEAYTEPLSKETTKVCFGPILYGPGRAWFDDLAVSAK